LVGLFFRDNKALIYFSLQSKVNRHVIHTKEDCFGFLKKMEAKSPDALIEFAKSNPTIAENKIIAFLSSGRARADSGENFYKYYKQLGQISKAFS
jgi:hypothetical protein